MYKISTNLGKLQKKIVFCLLLCREPRLLKVHFWGGIGNGKWNIVHWQLAVMDNFTCKVANATQKKKENTPIRARYGVSNAFVAQETTV